MIEMVPEMKTVWTIENDTMGIGKMLIGNRFVCNLKKLSDFETKVTNETYYRPANLIAKIMSSLMMKTMFGKMQEQILTNLKTLTER